MKLWALGPIVLGVAIALVPPAQDSYALILTGDMDGLLTPCGCTRPMSGGIRRLATAVKSLSIPGKTLLLVNGGLVENTGRQNELKAEAFAQALRAMQVTALKVGKSELALGRGTLISLSNVAEGRLIGSEDLREKSGGAIAATIQSGPFLIGCGDTASDIEHFVDEAKSEDLRSVLLLSGSLSEAQDIAARYPSLALIQYRSGGHPSKSWAGNVLLATPGEKGKEVVKLIFSRDHFSSYSSVDLGPQYGDDPNASRVFKQYLSRVDDERLIDFAPRGPSADFAGTQACGKCHSEAMKVWQHSSHAGALKSLKTEGEHLDPECVRCHVVGFESEKGYVSEAKTPALSSVGCESCHGPGKAHGASPYVVKLLKVTEAKCASCHTTEQSPNFQFSTFWPRVKHK